MLKNMFAAALALAMVVSVPVASKATEAKAPKFSGGIVMQNPSFIGITAAVLNATGHAAPSQIVNADQGLLYGICRYGDYLDYAMAFDYDAPGAGALNTYIVLEYEEYSITPHVYSDSAGDGTEYPVADSVRGCWWPVWPVRFEDGLVGISNDTTGYTVFYYRLDSGVNP